MARRRKYRKLQVALTGFVQDEALASVHMLVNHGDNVPKVNFKIYI